MLRAWLAVVGAAGWLQVGEARDGGSAVPPAAPLALIQNAGQWSTDAELIGQLGPLVVRLERAALLLQLRQGPDRGVLVRLGFDGATGPIALEGQRLRPERFSYFLGNDPTRWQRSVPAWEQALYREVWPGIDLLVRAEGGSLKYDLLVAPGADLERAVLAVSGADAMRLTGDGALVLETGAGPIAKPLPRSYEVLPSGEHRPIPVHYRLLDGQRLGFVAPGREPSLPLVIDPGLIWSSYLGSASVGSVGDRVHGIALGPNGEAIVVGIADWIDFPVTPGAYATASALGERAFVSVFDPSGSSLVYSCVVGGTQINGYTRALAVGVDATRHVVVAGWTGAPDFPATPGAFDTQKNADHSAFVFKLESDGSDLVYSTFLEGSDDEMAYALAVTPGGSAIVAGDSYSQDFPTSPGAYDVLHGPFGTGFVSRLDPSGSYLEFSTYLKAGPRAVALDVGENVYATGIAGSTFPATAGAFDKTWASPYVDCFVAKLSSDGKSLHWGTFLGGTGEDRANAIAVDPQGGVAVAGTTISNNFPVTSGAFQTAHSPSTNYDGFVTRLNATGSALIYSTYLGGISWDEPFGVAVDAGGVVTVAGLSANATFPTTPGAYDVVPYSAEGFVARLAADGKRLLYSSFVGGTGSDRYHALAMDSAGIVTVGGETTGDYPVTPGCFAPAPFGGQTDGMVTRMDLLPKGAVPFGASTPSCYGPIVIGVTEMPAAGSTTFGLYASGAPPGGTGFLGLASTALVPGLPIAGLSLLLDPSAGLVVLPASVQGTPYAEVTVPIPAGSIGLRAHAQFVFVNTPTCGGAGTLSATNALELEIQ